MGTHPREALLKQLQDTMNETVPYFVQSESVQQKSYAPGKWTMRELLAHLSDTETVYLDRLRRLAAERKPVLQAFDQDLWAAALLYKTRDLHLAKDQYKAARRGIMELARELDAALDTKTGQHTEAGAKTFAQVLQTVVSHNAHHLEQLRAVVAGKEWKKEA